MDRYEGHEAKLNHLTAYACDCQRLIGLFPQSRDQVWSNEQWRALSAYGFAEGPILLSSYFSAAFSAFMRSYAVRTIDKTSLLQKISHINSI